MAKNEFVEAEHGAVYLWLSAELTNRLLEKEDGRKLLIQQGARLYRDTDNQPIYTTSYSRARMNDKPGWRNDVSASSPADCVLVGILKSRVVIQSEDQKVAYQVAMAKIKNIAALPAEKDYSGVPALSEGPRPFRR